MRFTLWVGAAMASAAVWGAVVSACSSSGDNGGFGPDGSVASTGDDSGAGSTDAHHADGDVVDQPDGQGNDQPDSNTGPQPDADAGPGIFAGCEPVQGPACDLALQNCGTGKECAVDTASDGGFTTACFDTTSSEHLDKGHGCCPSSTQKQCDPGLECIGDPNLPCDGGTPAGRCTPHCCQGDAGDIVCGASDPEGYAGHCDSNIVDSTTTTSLFYACSYDSSCKPFHVKSCPSGTICLVKDSSGAMTCSTIYDPDGGPVPGEDQPCSAGNSCQDGLVCLTNQDGGSSCSMLCLTPSSIPPFDAGALDGGPFNGGCSTGKQCLGQVTDFPGWLSVCVIP